MKASLTNNQDKNYRYLRSCFWGFSNWTILAFLKILTFIAISMSSSIMSLNINIVCHGVCCVEGAQIDPSCLCEGSPPTAGDRRRRGTRGQGSVTGQRWSDGATKEGISLKWLKIKVLLNIVARERVCCQSPLAQLPWSNDQICGAGGEAPDTDTSSPAHHLSLLTRFSLARGVTWRCSGDWVYVCVIITPHQPHISSGLMHFAFSCLVKSKWERKWIVETK